MLARHSPYGKKLLLRDRSTVALNSTVDTIATPLQKSTVLFLTLLRGRTQVFPSKLVSSSVEYGSQSTISGLHSMNFKGI